MSEHSYQEHAKKLGQSTIEPLDLDLTVVESRARRRTMPIVLSALTAIGIVVGYYALTIHNDASSDTSHNTRQRDTYPSKLRQEQLATIPRETPSNNEADNEPTTTANDSQRLSSRVVDGIVVLPYTPELGRILDLHINGTVVETQMQVLWETGISFPRTSDSLRCQPDSSTMVTLQYRRDMDGTRWDVRWLGQCAESVAPTRPFDIAAVWPAGLVTTSGLSSAVIPEKMWSWMKTYINTQSRRVLRASRSSKYEVLTDSMVTTINRSMRPILVVSSTDTSSSIVVAYPPTKELRLLLDPLCDGKITQLYEDYVPNRLRKHYEYYNPFKNRLGFLRRPGSPEYAVVDIDSLTFTGIGGYFENKAFGSIMGSVKDGIPDGPLVANVIEPHGDSARVRLYASYLSTFVKPPMSIPSSISGEHLLHWDRPRSEFDQWVGSQLETEFRTPDSVWTAAQVRIAFSGVTTADTAWLTTHRKSAEIAFRIVASFVDNMHPDTLSEVEVVLPNASIPVSSFLVPLRYVSSWAPWNGDTTYRIDVIVWVLPTERLFSSLPAHLGKFLRERYTVLLDAVERELSQEEICEVSQRQLPVCRDTAATNMSVVSVGPTPLRDELHITLRAKLPCVATISIADLAGTTVKTLHQHNAVSGLNDVVLPLGDADLPPGTYFVVIQSGRDISRTKVLKVR